MTSYIDVFNGDADGLCALTQWRHHQPVDSTLITGVKRDIQLLDKVQAQAGDQVTVFDLSLDKNRAALIKLLGKGVDVFYVDHHFAGDIPASEHLTTSINTAADICTSLLINKHLQGQCKMWAIVGALGDNLKHSARALGCSLALSEQQWLQLEQLGTALNYNSYGLSVEDLHVSPMILFEQMRHYTDPFVFIDECRPLFDQLVHAYQADCRLTETLTAEFSNNDVAVFILPDAPWARRISGVYSNNLANQTPTRAHAVLTLKPNGHYMVSLRAPLAAKEGADRFCRRFPTGGGRAAAAGINDLPADQLHHFIDALSEFYPS